MSYTFESPFQYIPKPEKFGAVGLGKLYIGVINGNPASTPADRIQAYIARQGLSDLAISQPIDISAGGVPIYQGAPVTIKVNSAYSCAVLDHLGAQVYYSPSSGDEITEFTSIDLRLDYLESNSVQTVETWESISTVTPNAAGQLFSLAQHTSGGIGGGTLMALVGSVTDDGGTQKNCLGGYYLKRTNTATGVDLYMFGLQPAGDIYPPLLAAYNASPGTHDLTTAYIYAPSWIIDIPYGNFTMSQRVVISKNNIIIRGQGMFNTNIKGPTGAQMNEMIRFKEAYACGLLNLTLDGGLPFTVTGSETYGVDIPLVTDQCAHFQLDQVNLCNYRVRGWQAIHLWESNIGEVRMFNGGYFAVAASTIPYCLAFDDFRKESTVFPGAESNQIYIAKLACSCPGGVINFESPCFNVQVGMVVAEGRTYSWLPLGMDTSKFHYSGVSALCVIKQAWCYFHEQSALCDSILIYAENAGAACSIDDLFLYQEKSLSAGNHLEVTKVFKTTSAFPFKANVSMQDAGGLGAETEFFDSASAGSLITGECAYRNSASRTFDDFIGSVGKTNFVGEITFSVGAFTSDQPLVYRVDGAAERKSKIDGSGFYSEYACRAWVKFNGTTGAIIGTARNVSGVVRNSAGNYTVTFTTAMPDADYAPFANSNASATGAERAYVAGATSSDMNVVNGVGAGFADATVITCGIFR